MSLMLLLLLLLQAVVLVERETQAPIILGRGGSAIKKLGSAARQQIEDFLGRKVFLELTVQVGSLCSVLYAVEKCPCWYAFLEVQWSLVGMLQLLSHQQHWGHCLALSQLLLNTKGTL
jgi:hypothetical protein